MEFLLVIGASQAFLLSMLIFFKNKHEKSDYLLGALFLAFATTTLLGFFEVYNRKNGYPFPHLINASTPTIFLHGPLLWLYILSLTSQQFKIKWYHLLHFAPFLFLTALFSASLYLLPVDEKMLIDREASFKDDILFPVVMGMVALFTQGYFFLSLWKIKRYNRQIKTFFSRTDDIDLHWLKFLLIGAVFAYASISLLYIGDYAFGWMSYALMQPLGFSFAAVFILMLGIYGLRQGNIFSSGRVNINMEDAIPSEPYLSTLDADETRIVKSLLDLMRREKPYLEPDLTLATLSNRIGCPPDQLSRILNGRLNRNFFDFVNSYRIEEFKTLCHDPKNSHLSIMGMAYDAGFNAKATFNRVFKKSENLTPGAYLRQVSAK